jgi:hypothetical protein
MDPVFLRSTITGSASTMIAFGPRAGLETIAAGSDGLVLRLRRNAEDELAYDISLVTEAGAGRRLIVADAVEDDVVALWRRMAADLGQKLMIETAEGFVSEINGQIGLVQLGSGHDRRRCSALTKRRPYFLKRRKVSRLPDRPIVLRGTDIPRS